MLRDKIIAFFDAAKDLALAIADTASDTQAETVEAPAPIRHDEVIKVRVPIGYPDHTVVEIRPKQRAMIMNAISWTAPCQYVLTSIKPTLPDPGGEPLDRLCPPSPPDLMDVGVDVHFFNVDDGQQICAFDFGIADPDNPIKVSVERMPGATEALDMSVFAFYLPEPTQATVSPAA